MTPQEVRKIWADALRSGNYKQAYGKLCRIYDNIKHYCCLGVLTDIALKEGVISEFYEGDTDNGKVLSRKVQEWAGLCARNGQYGGVSINCLSSLNDGGHTFEYIADVIENPPDRLFCDPPATSVESTISEGA